MRRTNSIASMSGEIEHVVTKLLRTTKALLEALTQWSLMRTSNTEIFEIHDTLEKQFFLVSQAFEEASIPMSDLQWIPRQLRDAVSAAMLEQPSPATLDQHLPRIREVIVHLLHGLKAKQAALREKERERESRGSIRSNNTESWNKEVPLAALNRGSSSSSNSNMSGSQRMMMNNQQQQQHGLPMPPYPPLSPKMGATEYEPWSGGMPRPTIPSNDLSARIMPRTGSMNRPYSPTQQQQSSPLPTRSSSSTRNNNIPQRMPSPPPPPPPLPPATIISPRPEPQSQFDENDPNTANALAALKRQENLARRSSVRRASMFRGGSSGDYNSTGSISRGKGNLSLSNYGGSQQQTNSIPPVPSLPAHHLPIKNVDYSASGPNQSNNDVNGIKLNTVNEGNEQIREEENQDLTLFLQIGKEVQKVRYNGEISIPALNMLFLERFSYSIRQDDFSKIYIRDPMIGVYYELQDLSEVQDKSVLSFNINEHEEQKKVQKEWLSEITTTFNKELKETRRQFAEQIDALKKEMVESISKNQTMEEEKEKKLIQQLTAQFLSAQEKVKQEVTKEEDDNDNDNDDKDKIENEAKVEDAPLTRHIAMEQLEAQRIEIETLRRDIAILRQLDREMREETLDVIAKMKEKVQEENEKKRKAEEEEKNNTTKYTSKARAELEEGKKTLLEKSDQVTNRLEDLQDTIDQLKLDVTQRKCRPSEAQMTHCANERKALAQEIEDFGKFIAQVKPRWKKTWEHELQTIVKEQQTLKDQEYLLSDMKDDLDALLEVFEQLEKIYAYQAQARPQAREFRVAPPEEGFEGMTSVLKQVATIDVDHSRRLRALEQADKMRQRELANRIDEFEKELVGFVDAKKLKKTGGALEIDRLRKQKDEEILKAMYAEKKRTAEESTSNNESLSEEQLNSESKEEEEPTTNVAENESE
ncbi:actin interacting protein 3-domain-containing protein [Cokeromyces recurvatus]|uniref:actin interacting protein 3-domain-containing protein n=1 Tax=Cokeromyces recurvatus TaxID=90255 RepID=UPI00221EF4E0|nr:actin interacting protein 3-domain-containing protein [Cokeromyces recurvatus]KAI7900330.1 actin interacting protein 3-domain-containing protein [Cokeromyces recurvatus]